MKKKLSILIAIAITATVTLLVLMNGAGPALASTDFQYCPGVWTGPSSNGCLTMQQLTAIQPGLGTIMIEVGHRNWVMNYAAKGGNWALADYQAKEMDEIMEVGTITRPGRAPALLHFMDTDGLPQVRTAIAHKNLAEYKTAMAHEVDTCNACHAANGFPYIEWNIPPKPPQDLTMKTPDHENDRN